MPLVQDQFETILHTLNAIITKILYPFRTLIATDVAVQVRNYAGAIGRYNIVNTATSIVYVKFYDSLTAPTGAGNVPFLTVPVPTGIGSGAANNFVIPTIYLQGLWVRCTTGVADTDTTNPATSPIIELFLTN